MVEHLGQLDFLHARENVVLLGPPGRGSHCTSCGQSLSNRSKLGGGNLDCEALSAAVGDVDRVQLAALDLVQHGLAGAAERAGGLVERHVAVGDVGHEAGADLVGEPDPPGRAGRGLLAGQQAVVEPAADGVRRDAELARRPARS